MLFIEAAGYLANRKSHFSNLFCSVISRSAACHLLHTCARRAHIESDSVRDAPSAIDAFRDLKSVVGRKSFTMKPFGNPKLELINAHQTLDLAYAFESAEPS